MDAANGMHSLGLTAAEAAQRLAEDGPNELPSPRGPSHLRELIAQLTHLFALMLWVAAALAFLARMPELGTAIVVVILVNGGFAFPQELRAERAAARLRSLLPQRATVLRDGDKLVVDAAGLVRGELVLLGAGDRVSADLDLLDVEGLSVDSSLLTGESVPSRPGPTEHVYAGMFVVEGEATGRVIATGARTRLAAIAGMTRTRSAPPTPLAREIQRLVRKTALIAATVGLAFRGRRRDGAARDRGVPLRRRCHGGARPGGAAADDLPLSRPRGETHGGPPRARP